MPPSMANTVVILLSQVRTAAMAVSVTLHDSVEPKGPCILPPLIIVKYHTIPHSLLAKMTEIEAYGVTTDVLSIFWNAND